MSIEFKLPVKLLKPDGVPGGGSEQPLTPEAAAVAAALAKKPEHELNAQVPPTAEQLTDPSCAPYINQPPNGPPVISVHAPAVSSKG